MWHLRKNIENHFVNYLVCMKGKNLVTSLQKYLLILFQVSARRVNQLETENLDLEGKTHKVGSELDAEAFL